MLQADLDLDWRAESAPERRGELLLLRVSHGACTGRSTGTCEAVSSGISSDAVSGPIIRRKERRGLRISNGWDWFVWRVHPSRALCIPAARVFRRAGRGTAASPFRRGESGSRFSRLLSYSTGSVPQAFLPVFR